MTSGVVSRLEVVAYSHSGRGLLAVQVGGRNCTAGLLRRGTQGQAGAAVPCCSLVPLHACNGAAPGGAGTPWWPKEQLVHIPYCIHAYVHARTRWGTHPPVAQPSDGGRNPPQVAAAWLVAGAARPGHCGLLQGGPGPAIYQLHIRASMGLYNYWWPCSRTHGPPSLAARPRQLPRPPAVVAPLAGGACPPPSGRRAAEQRRVGRAGALPRHRRRGGHGLPEVHQPDVDGEVRALCCAGRQGGVC